MSLLERCPHFRGCYVQASMELGCVPIRALISEGQVQGRPEEGVTIF